jgi:hypothetical protein
MIREALRLPLEGVVKSFLAALLLVTSSAACGRTLTATVTQPNPLKYPAEVERRSEKLVIHTKDMELPRAFLLRQSAYFSVVSRDRLRFHVRLTHKWDEFADISQWDVKLVDDRGRVYDPEAKEVRKNQHITRMWDRERRTAQWNSFGDVTKINNDGYKERVAMDSVDVFKGTGDFSFFGQDIFTREVRELTLTMKKGELAFKFVWKFSDDPREWRAFRGPPRESADYEEDFETAAVCTDLQGRPMPLNGGCFSGSDAGRGR